MYTKYAEAFSEVITRTFDFMFPVKARMIERRSEYRREAPFEVSGIIGISGPKRGSIIISFPLEIARQLTAWMLSEENAEDCTNTDMSDCVGELTNIVAGNLLPCLFGDETDQHCFSLPSVVMGPHEVVWSSRDTPCELMLFETDVGPFAAEINLREEG